jgi:endonuclease G
MNFAVSIDSVEIFTGIDFYYSLPDSIEDSIESNVNLPAWFKN